MGDHNDIPVQNADELDDVEGHGLREVAAAAGIGAAVLGAGGAAVAATASHPGPAPMMIKPPSIVSQTADDGNTLVTDATTGAGGVAKQSVNDTEALAGHTLAQVNSITAPVIATATNTVSGAEALATKTANDATTLAGHEVTAATAIVNQTERDALNAVNSVERTALGTVTSTEHTAFTTADSALKTATTQVSAVESTTMSVVNSTLDKVGKGWTLDLSILGAHVSTGGNMLAPSGTVTVTDVDGHTLGTAKVANGTATVSFDAAGHSGQYTIHYVGNLPSTNLVWLSPTL